jgi:hypothetical protein
MIRVVATESRFPMNEAVARFNRLFLENPHAFDQLLAWIGDTEYGEVTLRFQAGKFCMVEQTRRTK